MPISIVKEQILTNTIEDTMPLVRSGLDKSNLYIKTENTNKNKKYKDLLHLMELTRIERATSCVQGRRSPN